MKELGFYVTLNLRGYSAGSMKEMLEIRKGE